MKKLVACIDYIIAIGLLVLLFLSKSGYLSEELDDFREIAFSTYVSISLICRLVHRAREANACDNKMLPR